MIQIGTWRQAQLLDWYIGDVATHTDQNGRFYLRINNPSCPGFSFEYTNYIFARLEYSHFNPLRRSMNPGFTEQRTAYNSCNGGTWSLPQLDSFSASNLRFPIDVVALTGKGDIRNLDQQGLPTHGVVPVASETQHSTNLPIFTEQVPVDLDLDADGLTDQAMLYEGEVYVYLNGRIVETNESGAPINEDLRRVPDQLTAEGLPDNLTPLGLPDTKLIRTTKTGHSLSY